MRRAPNSTSLSSCIRGPGDTTRRHSTWRSTACVLTSLQRYAYIVGPTAVGTAVGRQFTSAAMSVVFLTLAAGSILYVVIQLLGVAHKSGRKDLLYRGVLLGLAAGFLTDMS